MLAAALTRTSDGRSALRRQVEARQAMKRLGRPEEIAYAIRFLACVESRFVIGTMLTADGGMTAR